MKLLTKKDIVSALATGITTGIIAWRILVFLGVALPFGLDAVLLAIIIPPLWVAGVQLGYFLGVFWRPMRQFGRFASIGFANAMVDFGILYLLIGISGLATGVAYSAFKALSFSVASTHSYLWNKYWTFDAAASRGGITEVGRFIVVAIFSLIINVGLASAVVALRPAGIATDLWAGVGAVVGAAGGLISNFAGLRLFVFGRK